MGTCRRCGLWKGATQGVFGEGRIHVPLMLVGEQPGNDEDLAGRPFVGPAGRVLDRALAEAGIDRSRTYVTNAVKHFKNEPRGKRRLHKKPDTSEIEACRWWLDLEISHVKPRLVVALGATAAQGVMRRTVTISKVRGRALDAGGTPVWVTVHPSYILRIPDRPGQQTAFQSLVADLVGARQWLDSTHVR